MHPTMREKTRPRAANTQLGELSFVDQLRQGLAEAGLDCRCEDQAERIVVRIDEIRRAGALKEARWTRDSIAIVMVLLAELDELTTEESDLSAYGEIADLFEDLANYAGRGAVLARFLAKGSPGANEGALS